jgi:ribosomal protein S18 acetylase RimI-like enzyme
MGLEVRPAIDKDINAVMIIARTDVENLGFEPKGAYLESAKTGKLLVAVLDEKYIVGFVKFGGVTKDKWTIYQIATAKIARGKGAGKALVEAMAKLAAENNAGIRLKVTAENNTAVAFYQHVGFRIVDKETPNKRPLFVMERECLS